MLDDKDIKNLFTMMTTLFGHKFKSAYGTGVNGNKLSITGKVWQRTLNGIPHIRQVIEKLFLVDSPIFESKEWCPDLRDVVQMCLDISKNIEQNIKRKTLKITRDEHNVRLSKYYVANYKGGNDKDYQYHLNNIKINGDNK
jgi:hypothetical protein